MGALDQLRCLFDSHSFWASGRSHRQLGRMLRGSATAVTLWQGRQLVGFGRATSDGIYRAVLWDVVVADDFTGQGLGRQLVEALLADPVVAACERVYLMTTNGQGFYEKLGFREQRSQRLMLREACG